MVLDYARQSRTHKNLKKILAIGAMLLLTIVSYFGHRYVRQEIAYRHMHQTIDALSARYKREIVPPDVSAQWPEVKAAHDAEDEWADSLKW